MVQCPKCGKNILDVADDGTPRLRSKVILFTDSGAVAQCPSCKEAVKVPVSLHTEKPKKPLLHYVKAATKHEQ